MKLAAFAALALLASCSHHNHVQPKRDAQREHRVIVPPVGQVRPLPPHAIRADGVGPYRLGAPLTQLLDQLPSGPRIATLDIPGVVDYSILRADDTILIGGQPLGKASFVAVVGPDVARTESGIHVGSTRDELIRALGPLDTDPTRARDPRLFAPSALPDARFVLDGDRVAAIVVIANLTPADKVVGTDPCPRPSDQPERGRFGACLAPGGQRVAIDGDDLAIRNAASDKLIATARVPGLVFAAPLRDAIADRDELVAVSRVEDPTERTWSLVAYRLDGGHLVKVIDSKTLYRLTASSARWIGAELHDLDLYLELTSRREGIEVGGLLTVAQDGATVLHDVVVISPMLVRRRRPKPAPEAPTGSPPVPGKLAATPEHHAHP